MSSSRSDDGGVPLTTIVHNPSRPTHEHSNLESTSETGNRSDDLARVPTITRHPAHMLSLSSPHLVESIASGAHYAGALSPDSHQGERRTSVHLRRSLSRPGDVRLVEEPFRAVMADLEELFCGRVTHEILDRRIAKNVEFEDHWCKCGGFTETASKFAALTKLYSRCERQQSRILSASLKPNQLVISQKYVYTLRLFGTKRTVSSLVNVDLDDGFKVIRMVDQWNGEELPVGRGMLWLRRFNGKVAPWLFHVPKRTSL